MGTLYGVVELAHLFDLYFGGVNCSWRRVRPCLNRCPWKVEHWHYCGDIKSLIGDKVADFGLVLYGLVEVAGAGVIRFGGDNQVVVGDMDPFVSTVVVQGIVALAWL